MNVLAPDRHSPLAIFIRRTEEAYSTAFAATEGAEARWLPAQLSAAT
jgi:hypothetical protein